MKTALVVGVFLATAAGLSACGDDESRTILTVDLDGDTLTVSGGPSAGAVDIQLTGDLEPGSEVDLTRVTDGTSADEFEAALAVVIEGGPFADFVLDNAGATVGGSAVQSVTLDEGSYFAWIEDGSGGIISSPFSVGDGDGAPLPSTDGVFTATDYGFAADVEAGDTFTFENEGAQFHHVVLFDFGDLDPAVVQENLPALFDDGGGATPPEAFAEVDFESLDAGGSPVFGPGSSGTFEVTLESGTTYGAVCFIQDRNGGPPHAIAHEMFTVFTVD